MKEIENIKDLLSKSKYNDAIDSLTIVLKKYKDQKNLDKLGNFRKHILNLSLYSQDNVIMTNEVIGLIAMLEDKTQARDMLMYLTNVRGLIDQFQNVLSENIENIANEVNSERNKILFLTSEVKGLQTLELDKEYYEVSQKLSKSLTKYKLLVSKATSKNFNDKIYEHRPCVIHFSGHGAFIESKLVKKIGSIVVKSEDNSGACIMLPDEKGNSIAIKEKTLIDLFRLCQKQFELQLVFFNACHTESQAINVSKLGIHVIGMNQSVFDSTAIEFAANFYNHLNNDEEVTTAFNLSINILEFNNVKDSEVPVLYFEGKKYDIESFKFI